MEKKKKTIWKPSKHSDFDFLKKDFTRLLSNGLYDSGNAFFQNDVLSYCVFRQSADNFELIKKNIITDLLFAARRFTPGTEILLTKMMLNGVPERNKIVRRLSSADALNHTKNYLKSQKSKFIIDQIVSLMGTSGRIHITEEPIVGTEIILRDKYCISIQPDKRFESIVELKNRIFDYAKVCVIEGAPASVSEINKLLMHCHEKNVFLLLLARSYPEEVINTLAVNWKKRKLRIIPLVYGTTIYNLNAHADLCSVSGATPLSSAITSTLDKDLSENFGELTNIQMDAAGITASSSHSPAVLKHQLETRLSKMDVSDTDRREIILRRLAGLSPKTLNVKIAKTPTSWQLKNEIEIAVALYNSFCQKAIFLEDNAGNCEIYPFAVYKKATELHNIYSKTRDKIGGYIVQQETKNKDISLSQHNY